MREDITDHVHLAAMTMQQKRLDITNNYVRELLISDGMLFFLFFFFGGGGGYVTGNDSRQSLGLSLGFRVPDILAHGLMETAGQSTFNLTFLKAPLIHLQA